MADIVTIAEEVAEAVDLGVKAEVMYAPELDLKGIRELRVIVVPCALGMKPLARGMSEDTLKVQVGLLKKATEDDLPELVRTVTELGRSFLDRRLADATCYKVEYAPLYSPEHLRERRQFTGVVELSFKAVTERR